MAIFRKRALDAELDDELDAHLDLLTRRNEARGMPPDDARRQAVLQMGGLTATRASHRDARGLPRAEAVTQAFSHAWRSWRSAKSIALLATIALAVGIGSATAIYTVVNAVMLKPLGYGDGHRFVMLCESDRIDTQRSETFRIGTRRRTSSGPRPSTLRLVS